MDDLTINGTWWLPYTPEHRAHGTLKITDGMVELETTEPLAPLPEGEVVKVWPAEWIDLGVVLGESVRGEQTTLLSVGGANLIGDTDFGRTETYTAKFAVIGGHVPEDSFELAQFQFNHLLAWAQPPAVATETSRHSYGIDTGRHVLDSATVDGATIELTSGLAGSWSGPSVHADQWCAFRVSTMKPASLQDLIGDWVRPLQDLLSVLTGLSVRLTALHVRTRSDSSDDLLSVYYAPLQVERQPEVSTASMWSYSSPGLFALRDLENHATFDELISRWLKLHKKHRMAIALTLATLYRNTLYDEHRFLTAFQSAERYAKSTYGGAETKATVHTARVESVIGAARDAGVPHEDVEWARRVLLSRNDKPLKKLLGELIDGCGPAGVELREANPNFEGVITKARGGHSHGKGGRSEPPRYWYSEALRWLIRGRLAVDLGVPADTVWDTVVGRLGFMRAVARVAEASTPAKRDQQRECNQNTPEVQPEATDQPAS